MRLTKRDVDSLTYVETDGRQQVLWDKEGSGKGEALSGFGVRVYPSGKKSFILFYRVRGRQHIKVLGQYGPLTLDTARDKAQKDLAAVLDGKDPLEEKQKVRRGTSFNDLCSAYMERHARQHKKSWVEDQRRIDRYLAPALGALRVDAISRADIAKLHAAVGQQYPYMANRCIEQLSKMFELAKVWGYLEETHINPAKRIDAFKEVKRDRWVKPDELPRLAKAINSERNLYGRQGLWLYLLTGLRRDELLNARWEDVDWGRKELRLPETKAGRIHYVPLSEPALAVLRELPREQGNEFILPGAKPGHHLVNIEKIWQRVRKAAGVEDIRLHDLRRTVGSWLAQSGNSLHLIGRVLNHSSQATTAIYARFAQDNVRQALEEHGKQILGAAKQEPIAEVVPMKKRMK